VFHYREDRIRAHVQLCWLALLLMRVVENATDDTWRNVRHELDRMHLATLATAGGHVAQRSATTAGQKTILGGLELGEPAPVLRLHRPQRLTHPPTPGESPPWTCSNTTPTRRFGKPQVNKADSIQPGVCSSSSEVRPESAPSRSSTRAGNASRSPWVAALRWPIVSPVPPE